MLITAAASNMWGIMLRKKVCVIERCCATFIKSMPHILLATRRSAGAANRYAKFRYKRSIGVFYA